MPATLVTMDLFDPSPAATSSPAQLVDDILKEEPRAEALCAFTLELFENPNPAS